MDRGIPAEEVLTELRQSETPVYYLLGNQTPPEQVLSLKMKMVQETCRGLQRYLAALLDESDSE